MKVKFLMDGGHTVTLELFGIEQVKAAATAQGWLWDDNGVGVNLAKVAGFTPVAAEPETPERPTWVIDYNGDRWELFLDGQYRINAADIGCALRSIERRFGIRERG